MRYWTGVVVLLSGLLAVGPGLVEAQQPAPAAAPAASSARIAYIDVQRVLARSSAGVAAREQLEREKSVMQKEMDGKRVELEKLRDELEKKGPLMTADARREKQEVFERKRRDAGDTPAGVALKRGAEGDGELTEREPGGLLHQGVFFGACVSYARMISSVRSASAEA